MFNISGVTIIDSIKITLLAENLLAKGIIINNNVSQKGKKHSKIYILYLIEINKIENTYA